MALVRKDQVHPSPESDLGLWKECACVIVPSPRLLLSARVNDILCGACSTSLNFPQLCGSDVLDSQGLM